MKNRLKELRNKKKLSQKAFAVAFNDYLKENKRPDDDFVSYATISRWENGQVAIPNNYIKDLANYFDVTVQYIQGLTYSEDQILGVINQNYIDRYDDYKRKGDFLEDPFMNDPLYLPVKNYLNYHYIEVDFSKNELKKFSDSVKNFWFKTFGFVFEGSLIKKFISYGGSKSNLISDLSKIINEKYLEDSQSIISRVFDETTDKKLMLFEYDKDELLRFGTKSDIKDRIDSLIASLNKFECNLSALPDNHNKPNTDNNDDSDFDISDDDLPF